MSSITNSNFCDVAVTCDNVGFTYGPPGPAGEPGEPGPPGPAGSLDFVQVGGTVEAPAVTRTVQDRLRDTVHLLDFIPVEFHQGILDSTNSNLEDPGDQLPPLPNGTPGYRYDCSAAFAAALNAVDVPLDDNPNPYMGSPKILFPPGTCYFASTIELNKSVILEGQSGAGRSTWVSRLEFAAGIGGIVVNFFHTYRGDMVPPVFPVTLSPASVKSGSNTIIRNLKITSKDLGAHDPTYNYLGQFVTKDEDGVAIWDKTHHGFGHGIWIRAQCRIENCVIQRFTGHGIYVRAAAVVPNTAEGRSLYGNANLTFISQTAVLTCGGVGLYIDGPDANAGNFIGCDFGTNQLSAVYESSLIGNNHIGHHTNDNGLLALCSYPTQLGPNWPNNIGATGHGRFYCRDNYRANNNAPAWTPDTVYHPLASVRRDGKIYKIGLASGSSASNIPWAPNTLYKIGEHRMNGSPSKSYSVTAVANPDADGYGLSGTGAGPTQSSGSFVDGDITWVYRTDADGPSGTAANIADGQCYWDFVAIDTNVKVPPPHAAGPDSIKSPAVPWAPSTAYARGKFVTNDDGKLYYARNPPPDPSTGISGTGSGPSGTGSSIADGTCVWDHMEQDHEQAFEVWGYIQDNQNPPTHPNYPEWPARSVTDSTPKVYHRGHCYWADRLAAPNVFIGCYTEGGQPRSLFITGTNVIGAMNYDDACTHASFKSTVGAAIITPAIHVPGKTDTGVNTRDFLTTMGFQAGETFGMKVQGDGSTSALPVESYSTGYKWDETTHTWARMWANSNISQRLTVGTLTGALATPAASPITGGRSVPIPGGKVIFPAGIWLGSHNNLVRHITTGDVVPTQGEWGAGDVVLNSSPLQGEPWSWRCVESGNFAALDVDDKPVFQALSGDPTLQTITTDAAFTLTPYTSARETLHTGTLTANRVVTLTASNAYNGAFFKITRTGGNVGGPWTLQIGNPALTFLSQNEYVDVLFSSDVAPLWVEDTVYPLLQKVSSGPNNYICTTSGTSASSIPWAPDTVYAIGRIRQNGGDWYICDQAGCSASTQPWEAGTYTAAHVGHIRANAGDMYILRTAGATGSGPTGGATGGPGGNGLAIPDGTCRWDYVAPVSAAGGPTGGGTNISDGTARWDWIASTLVDGPANVWTANTPYAVGHVRANGANLYICTDAGTSAASGGPTGTGAGIVDGAAPAGCVWDYLLPNSAAGIKDGTAVWSYTPRVPGYYVSRRGRIVHDGPSSMDVLTTGAITLTPFNSNPKQVFSGAFGAVRDLTLAIANAYNGMTFNITRNGTGASALNVGTIGITAWNDDTIYSAGLLRTNDTGKTYAIITAGTSASTTAWAAGTYVQADLNHIRVKDGTMYILRKIGTSVGGPSGGASGGPLGDGRNIPDAGGGTCTWDFVPATPTTGPTGSVIGALIPDGTAVWAFQPGLLKAMPAGSWGDFTFNGTNWYLAAGGTL